MWRGHLILFLLVGATIAFAQDITPPPASAPAEGPSAALGPARPSTASLRQDLAGILARPEFEPAGRNWWAEFWLRLLGKVVQWFSRTFAPFFGELYAARPIVYWTVVAVVWVVLVGLLYHIYWTLRSALGTGSRRPKAASETVLPPPLGGPEELLRQADQAAATGDFPLAFRWLYLALIRHLDRSSVVRFDRSSTDSEYLRQLRPPPDVRRYLEPLTRAVEPVWYGYQSANADDYRRCRECVTEAWREGDTGAAT